MMREELMKRFNIMVPASVKETMWLVPITDLKIGDELRYKVGAGQKFPKIGEVVVVSRIISPRWEEPTDEGGNKRCADFYAFLKDEEGEFVEFAFDSRFFERA